MDDVSARRRRGAEVRARRLAGVLLAVALVACGGPASVPSSGAATATVAGLPGCGKPPSPDPAVAPPGAVVPPDARITAVRNEPPLVQLNGYVEATPLEVQAWVERQSALEVQAVQAEGDEIQMLVIGDGWRTFVKVRAVCATGSLFAEVIAPEGSDAVLPAPAAS